MLGKTEGKRKGMTTEDEMVGRHHQVNGHEFEQTLGDGKGQGGLPCCSSWGLQEPDTTELLNNNNTAQLEQIRNHIEKYQKPNCCF